MQEIKIELKKSCQDSNSDYHSHKSISASGLKTISKYSPSYHANKVFETNKNLELGSAIHTAILEPKKFDYEFYILPEINLRTKAGKAEKLEHEKLADGKILLTKSDIELVEKIYEAFHKNKEAAELLNNKIEISHYGKINGVDVRCRPDILGFDFVADIKSCQDASPAEFSRACKNWRWYLQAVFYSDFLKRPAENFKFIAVSKSANPQVRVYGLKNRNIDLGRWQWQEALKRWDFYNKTGICPGEFWGDYRDNLKLI
mgnify:FL=1